MRFVFSPPAGAASGLLTLPWREPLEDWCDERLVEIRQRGLSRHVVRFVIEDSVVYALKELHERLARKEYQLLRRLREGGVPPLEGVGVVVGPPSDPDPGLLTQVPYHSRSYPA